MPFTPAPLTARLALGLSHPAAPLSPEATNTLMPCAAACCQRLFQNRFPEVPMAASHKPKLELMTGARLWLTIYCAESSAPSVELVDAESTNWMEAFLATAPDHSTSNSASVCSLEETVAGFRASC